MKTPLRLFLVIFVMTQGLMPVWGKRDVKLTLNKINFVNLDTVKVNADFIGFEDDPIVGDVYADIISPQDSVIKSAVMVRNADGTYSATLPIPPNELNTHRDITRLCHDITIEGDDVLSGGKYVALSGMDTNHFVSEKQGGVMKEFEKIPFHKITYVCIMPDSYWSYKNHAHEYFIYYETQKSHPVNNVFTLQVWAQLQSGETVAGVKSITLPVVHFTVYLGDPELKRPPNHFLHPWWIKLGYIL